MQFIGPADFHSIFIFLFTNPNSPCYGSLISFALIPCGIRIVCTIYFNFGSGEEVKLETRDSVWQTFLCRFASLVLWVKWGIHVHTHLYANVTHSVFEWIKPPTAITSRSKCFHQITVVAICAKRQMLTADQVGKSLVYLNRVIGKLFDSLILILIS